MSKSAFAWFVLLTLLAISVACQKERATVGTDALIAELAKSTPPPPEIEESIRERMPADEAVLVRKLDEGVPARVAASLAMILGERGGIATQEYIDQGLVSIDANRASKALLILRFTDGSKIPAGQYALVARLVGSGNEQLSLSALVVLVGDESEQSQQVIKRSLREGSREVKEGILLALSIRGKPWAFPIAQSLLRDSNEDVRIMAIKIIYKLDKAKATKIILRHVDKSDRVNAYIKSRLGN